MNAPREHVLSEMRRAGLIPPEGIYWQARTAITVLGQETASRLEKTVGPRVWTRGLAPLCRPYLRDDMARMLGFGAALTSYAISGLPIKENNRTRVIELGALANLIVSLYDQFIDTGVSHKILPTYQLALAASDKTRLWATRFAWMQTAPGHLLFTLVAIYFERLDALSLSMQRGQIKKSVLKTIYSMYEAEKSTFVPASPPKVNQLRRKSALPFVTMGMPAWLVTEMFSAALYWGHIRWLYSLGLLIGYIDDAVDNIEDQRQGLPNLLQRKGVISAVNEVIRLANVVKTPYLICDYDYNFELISTREALRTCIASWFGGASILVAQ